MAAAMVASPELIAAAESSDTVGGASDHLFRRLFLPAIWLAVEVPVAGAPGALFRTS